MHQFGIFQELVLRYIYQVQYNNECFLLLKKEVRLPDMPRATQQDLAASGVPRKEPRPRWSQALLPPHPAALGFSAS